MRRDQYRYRWPIRGMHIDIGVPLAAKEATYGENVVPHRVYGYEQDDDQLCNEHANVLSIAHRIAKSFFDSSSSRAPVLLVALLTQWLRLKISLAPARILTHGNFEFVRRIEQRSDSL